MDEETYKVQSACMDKAKGTCTCKVRNEIETKRNETNGKKRNQSKRNETNRNETKRNETKIETKLQNQI
jgi:hypothetical protein